MRPRNIIPRESVYTQRADYLGVTNSLSWEELWWWKGRTNGEGFRGENTRIFSVVAVSPAILVPFFFPFLFSLPQAFTIEKATRRRAKRRWTIENRNFVFARKNKTPLLVCRSGDHRCFSKRSKNLRASGENSRFSLGSSTSYATTIFTDGEERKRERKRGEKYSLQRGSFLLANFSFLSLSFCGRTGSILKSDSRREGKKKKKRNWRRGKKT